MQWLNSYLIKMKLKFSDILTIVIPAWEYIFYMYYDRMGIIS